MEEFLLQIAQPLYSEGRRLLIFTEYRATQDYLVAALAERLPKSKICQIHGGMSLEDKLNNIGRFNDDGHFMVSTEAGGEGINLHHGCHVMANYDLPWNPGRLVQRAGRLYRYGQDKRVIVFNMRTNDSFDDEALNKLYSKIWTTATDMAAVSADYHEGLETEIIGELLDRVDMASLLAANTTMDISRSEQDIDEAVTRAQEAKALQDKLFSQVEGYDPATGGVRYAFDSTDILVFLEGILPQRGVKVRSRLYDDRVLELELPDSLRGHYSEFPGRRSVVRVTPDRALAMRLTNVEQRAIPMDFRSDFFRHLVEFAESQLQGQYASINGPRSGTLALYKLRWQNDQGLPTQETLFPVFLPEGSKRPEANPDFFRDMLLQPQLPASHHDPGDAEARRGVLAILDEAAHSELARRCTALLHPNDVVLLATADITARS